jgi:curved DNA-binding protein CbpA
MSTTTADPYAVLGVATDATDDDLDQAFRCLVRRMHPELRPNEPDLSDDEADRRFQEVLDAYATLRDPIRRADYDRTRQALAPAY